MTDLPGLRAALAKARGLGYALDDQVVFVGNIQIDRKLAEL